MMQFEDAAQIAEIAAKNGTSVFIMPAETELIIPQAIILTPEEKTTITIEQVRAATAGMALKQTGDRFIVIRPAEKLGLEAANALLKNLEEPGERVHYILVAESVGAILPTILSRAAVYFLKPKEGFNLEIAAGEAQKMLAKQLIAGKPADLVKIAETVSKKKTARADALELLGLTIEMLYKSYFITGKMVFIQKIPKFLEAYQNISKNGHVKLHLVADLC